MIIVLNSSTHRIGFQVILRFQITQYARDEMLMKKLMEYLDCGNVVRREEAVDLKVTKFSDIDNKIIPFFVKYRILGCKYEDWLDFCKVVNIMKEKGHLTKEGLDEIKKIKAGMNRGRE